MLINPRYADLITAADCAAIAKEYGADLHPLSGGKWYGPCPICGGKDRFEVYPDRSGNGVSRWSCRGCGVTCGDALNLIIKLEGLHPKYGIKEAAEILARFLRGGKLLFSGEPKKAAAGQPQPQRTPAPAAGPVLYKSAEWQRVMNDIVLESVAELWNTRAGSDALDYLYLERVIASESILKESRIGYNSRLRTYHIDGVQVSIFPGIVIPAYEETPGITPLTRVKIRAEKQPNFQPPAKYMLVKGSRGDGLFMGIYALRYPYIVWCEGEMDALSINSMEYDDIRAVTFGSATGCGSAAEYQRFYSAPEKNVVCFDNDDMGFNGSVKLWREMTPVSRNKPGLEQLPRGYKDFNEILQHADFPQERFSQIMRGLFHISYL